MAEPQRIFSDPWDVNRRLGELELSAEVLMRAISESQAARAACTENDAPNFPGIAAWNAAIRCHREKLLPMGWTRFNDYGLPLTIRPDGNLALTATSADENTGKEGQYDPKTNSSKGPRTVEKIKDNRWLFEELAEDEATKIETVNKRRRNTWMHLLHYDRALGQVRSELSRPSNITLEGFICEWSQRIILPPFDVEPEFVALPEEGSAPNGDAIDIAIKRRA